MKKIIIMLLIVSPFAVCSVRMPTDQEIDRTVIQTMEVSRRVAGNGMSYQMLKRCGASTTQ